MPSWSIPYIHNTHTRARRIDIRTRLLFFYRPTAGRNRGNATTGNKGGEDRNPAREAKSESGCKTSRSFHLLRPYISPIPERSFFFFPCITYISSFESRTEAKCSEDCKWKEYVILFARSLHLSYVWPSYKYCTSLIMRQKSYCVCSKEFVNGISWHNLWL